MADVPDISLHAEPLTHLGPLQVTNSILATWLAMLVLFGFLFIVTRRLKLVPGGLQNTLELVLEQFYGLVQNVFSNDKHTRRYLPLVIGIFLFVLVGNWVALIPGFGTIGYHHDGAFVPYLRAPAADVNTTLALALISFLVIQFAGIAAIGAVKYASKFLRITNPLKRPLHVKNVLLFIPKILLGLQELITELAKIISLSFRLFGNIYGGEVLLVTMAVLLPVVVPGGTPFYLLEVFVGLLQAFVFAMLTVVFIKVAMTEPH